MILSQGLIEKLEKIKQRYEFLGEELSKSEVLSNQNQLVTLSKEHSELAPICETYMSVVSMKKQLEDLEQLQKKESDEELNELVKAELEELKESLEDKLKGLKILLLPKDPNDDNNVIVEIRAGVGGDEAGLFATDLMRMYQRYADKNRWKIEEISLNNTELGGTKEAIFLLSGRGAYGNLKYESGVHRVQRVPDTESQGRVHTSTVTVAVLPEVEDIEVEIKDADLKIDTFRSGGAGGQHVNKTESAIRITHLPTNLVVECQDERSQMKNKDKAMKVLKSRLYELYKSQSDAEYAKERKMQVGTGERCERIRTYNFPQGRVTDHRIGLTLYSLEKFMLGEIDEMLIALKLDVQNRLLKNIDE